MFNEGTTFQIDIDPVGRASISELRRVFFDDLDASSRQTLGRCSHDAGAALPSWTPMSCAESPSTPSEFRQHRDLHECSNNITPPCTSRSSDTHTTISTTAVSSSNSSSTDHADGNMPSVLSSTLHVHCFTRSQSTPAPDPARARVISRCVGAFHTVCVHATSLLVRGLGNIYFSHRMNKLPEVFVTMTMCGANVVGGALVGVIVKRVGGSFVTHTAINLIILKLLCMCGYASVQWGSIARDIASCAQESARFVGGNSLWFRRVQSCLQAVINASLPNSVLQTAFGVSTLVGIFLLH